MKLPYITVVIPVFRANAHLPELWYRIEAAFISIDITFEVIFVEDCGGDSSWEVIKKLAQNDSRVKGMHMSRNYGQHNAILAGVRAAKGELIITMDDDLQHPPEEFLKLIDKINEGYDVVYAPPQELQHGAFRNLASKITKIALQSAMGAETARNVSAFRIFKTSLRAAFENYKSPTINIDVLLTWATTNFGVCQVRHDVRKHGTSGYTTRKLIAHAMNMMTGFSTIPLKIASLVGIIFSLFGLVVLIYTIVRYLVSDGGVAGFPFLASIISIFSGAQLLALGIIGEYLGRMHQRSIERPTYLVKESTESL